jgi:hypothetical protein
MRKEAWSGGDDANGCDCICVSQWTTFPNLGRSDKVPGLCSTSVDKKDDHVCSMLVHVVCCNLIRVFVVVAYIVLFNCWWWLRPSTKTAQFCHPICRWLELVRRVSVTTFAYESISVIYPMYTYSTLLTITTNPQLVWCKPGGGSLCDTSKM